MIIPRFDRSLNLILEGLEDYESAVAIVQYKDTWLLGLSTNSDSRKNKWCHPGGRIRRGESPEKAAERECYEETGVRCRATGKPFTMPEHNKVAFVPCKAKGNPKLDPNSEFSAVGFFTIRELRSLKLYDNVRNLIDRVRRKNFR